MRRTVAALVVILALVAAACSSGDESSDTTDTTAIVRVDGSPFGADDLLPLSLEGGDDARIVDADGRQVLLRGVNLNTLGDYYQDDPELDATFPYDEADFAEMATLGFDVVRLLVSWSLLEPEPGQIDDAYIARIHDAVDAAAAQGLYTVIDMHQDAYSKFVATPEGETCPDDLQPAVGWDGAPEWATLTDGRSTCNNASRESAGAVVAAWNNFWADTDGIQGHLVDVWQRLGEEFAAEPAVAGYDLLNEPGFGPGVDDTNIAMAAFYGRAIEAIRAGEAAVPDSTPHLVFFEPAILWSGLGDAPVPNRSATIPTWCSHPTCTPSPSPPATSPSPKASPPRPRRPRRTTPPSGSASTGGSATPTSRPGWWPSTPTRRTGTGWAAPGGSGARRVATPTRWARPAGNPTTCWCICTAPRAPTARTWASPSRGRRRCLAPTRARRPAG